MKILYSLSFVFIGGALALAPILGMAQYAPSPETAIPRHTDKGGHGNFVPPPDRKLPPDPHHDIPAHPSHAKQARNTKNAKNGSAGTKSSGTATGRSESANSH